MKGLVCGIPYAYRYRCEHQIKFRRIKSNGNIFGYYHRFVIIKNKKEITLDFVLLRNELIPKEKVYRKSKATLKSL